MFKVGVLTVSDKGSVGERVDESGRLASELARSIPAEVAQYAIVPDELGDIANKLIEWSDNLHLDLILTTGGTGFSLRDVTPEATKKVIDRDVPGLAEGMRAAGRERSPRAMLSRAVSGIRGETLIVNLPGSPRGVQEFLNVLLPVLPHALEILKDRPTDHR